VNLLQNDTVRITLSFMRNQVEFTESPNNFGDRLDLRDYNVEVYNSTGLIAASYSTISNSYLVVSGHLGCSISDYYCFS